jgi:hypothetical protein
MDFIETGCGYMDWIFPAQDGMIVGSCEHGNNPTKFMKEGIFFN